MKLPLSSIVTECIRVLEKGGTLLYPNETGWGIGCDATHQEAVSKVRAITNHPQAGAILCLVGTDRQLGQLIPEVPEVAWDLIDLSEKPLAICFDNPKGVAPNLAGKDNTLAVLLTTHPFCRELLRRLRKPLVFVPADRRGGHPPSQFSEIAPAILNAVDYVVPLEQETLKRTPPTLIQLKADGQVRVIRP